MYNLNVLYDNLSGYPNIGVNILKTLKDEIE